MSTTPTWARRLRAPQAGLKTVPPPPLLNPILRLEPSKATEHAGSMNANSRLTTARFFRRMHHEGQAQAQAQAAGSVRLANKNSQFKARDGNTSHEEHPEKRQEKAFKPVDGLLREALARLRAPGVRR